MGNKKTGILSLLTSKGTLRKKRGKPRLAMWKAWLQLTEHRNFLDLMLPHFKKQKGYTYKNAEFKIKDEAWKENFYKNNIVRSRLIEKLKKIEFTYT